MLPVPRLTTKVMMATVVMPIMMLLLPKMMVMVMIGQLIRRILRSRRPRSDCEVAFSVIGG